MKRLLAVLLCLTVASSAYARHSRGGGVAGGMTPSITTSLAQSAIVGTFTSIALAATGGTGNYSFSRVSVTPNTGGWLQVNGSEIVGTPQMNEAETAVIQVTDTVSGLHSQSTFTVTPTVSGSLAIVTSPTLTAGVNNSLYTKESIASGGSPPYRWISSNAQPWYMTLDGWVEGTPTSTGTVSALSTVTVTDAAQNTVTFAPTVVIATGFVLGGIDPDTGYLRLPDAIVGNLYSHQVLAYGGTGSGQTFSITSGSLPAGLSMSSSGLITGTPTQSGAVLPTVKVVDSGSNMSSASALITVANASNISRPAYNPTVGSGFFTANSKFYDPNGYEFRIRGLDRNHYDSAAWTGHTNGALSGANTVRDASGLADQTPSAMATQVTNEYVDNGIFSILTEFTVGADFTGVLSGSGASTILTVSAMSGTINNYTGNVIAIGMTLGGAANGGVITGQSSGTSGGVGVYTLATTQTGSGAMTGTIDNTSGYTDPNVVVCATNQIVWTLANGLSSVSANIAINIANEWGPANSTVWRAAYIAAIGTIRTAGFNGPLVIDAGGSGQDEADIENYGAAVLAADPLGNILFSYHMYGGADNVVGIITGITKANPAVISIAGSGATHPFAAGYPGNNYMPNVPYFVAGVQGMTQINGTVTAGNNSVGGASGSWNITTTVNSSSFGTYTSGGIIVDSGNYQQIINRLSAAANANGFTVIIGEFGPGQNVGDSPTIVTPNEVVNAAEANGLGWLYWAYDDNNQSGDQSDWIGWFGATGPINTSFSNGNYVPSEPYSLTQPGMDIIPSPRYGLQALANRANTYL